MSEYYTEKTVVVTVPNLQKLREDIEEYFQKNLIKGYRHKLKSLCHFNNYDTECVHVTIDGIHSYEDLNLLDDKFALFLNELTNKCMKRVSVVPSWSLGLELKRTTTKGD